MIINIINPTVYCIKQIIVSKTIRPILNHDIVKSLMYNDNYCRSKEESQVQLPWPH